MISDSIKAKLKTVSDITDLVGTGADARIFEEYQSQSAALPHIVFEEFPGGSNEHLGGATGIGETRLQINTFSTTKALSHALAELIRSALQGFRGDISGQFVNGITSTEGYTVGHDKPEASGGNTYRFYHSRDYEIAFAE